jgi:dihydroxyacetone kinase DhaKLM complex PTS-EIIA-like component DhaM
VSGEDPDIGEAVEYIMAERRKLVEDDIWAVLMELGSPPPQTADAMAVQLLEATHPHIRGRTVKVILREWRAYVSLATEPDWDDED